MTLTLSLTLKTCVSLVPLVFSCCATLTHACRTNWSVKHVEENLVRSSWHFQKSNPQLENAAIQIQTLLSSTRLWQLMCFYFISRLALSYFCFLSLSPSLSGSLSLPDLFKEVSLSLSLFVQRERERERERERGGALFLLSRSLSLSVTPSPPPPPTPLSLLLSLPDFLGAGTGRAAGLSPSEENGWDWAAVTLKVVLLNVKFEVTATQQFTSGRL